METSITFPELKISLVILGTLVFFYLYFYLAHADFLTKRLRKLGQPDSEVKLFITRKMLGLIFLAIIPGLLYFSFLKPTVQLFEFFKGNSSSAIYVVLILVSIILLMTFINQKSNPDRSSLQMKISDWNISLFGINAFGWSIYLLAYEFLFRGILLFECNESFGFWPAIAINVTIYSAIHMINSKDEAIGALFFGAIACYFTLQYNTILIPVIMHIALSLSSDYFSIRINKNLSFVKSGTIKTSNS